MNLRRPFTHIFHCSKGGSILHSDANITFIECVNRLDMRLLRRQGSGRQSTSAESPSVLCIFRRQRSCREGIFLEIQPIWTWRSMSCCCCTLNCLLAWVPVATNSLLSLWPQVKAVTALCTNYTWYISFLCSNRKQTLKYGIRKVARDAPCSEKKEMLLRWFEPGAGSVMETLPATARNSPEHHWS